MGLREVRSRVAPRSSQRREARSPRLQVCLDSRSARACKVSLQNTAKHVCCDGVLLSRLALQCPCARVAHGDCIPAIVCYPNSGLSPYPTGTAQSLLNFQSCSDVPRKRGPSHGTSHGSVGRRTGRPTSRIRLASTCVAYPGRGTSRRSCHAPTTPGRGALLPVNYPHEVVTLFFAPVGIPCRK